MHVKEKGLAPWAPSRVDMCALQIFCIIIICSIETFLDELTEKEYNIL